MTQNSDLTCKKLTLAYSFEDQFDDLKNELVKKYSMDTNTANTVCSNLFKNIITDIVGENIQLPAGYFTNHLDISMEYPCPEISNQKIILSLTKYMTEQQAMALLSEQESKFYTHLGSLIPFLTNKHLFKIHNYKLFTQSEVAFVGDVNVSGI